MCDIETPFSTIGLNLKASSLMCANVLLGLSMLEKTTLQYAGTETRSRQLYAEEILKPLGLLFCAQTSWS